MKSLKHSGRRAFLQGAGALTLTLPLLEYTHGEAFAQGDAAKRFITVFSHGGTVTDAGRNVHNYNQHGGINNWRPLSVPGEMLRLGQIHETLIGMEDQLMILEGINNRTGIAQGEYGGGHGFCNVSALTCADIGMSGEDPIARDRSIDFAVASALAASQPVAFAEPIHMNVSGHQYGGPYFRGDGERVSGETSPRAAFERIFAGVSGDAGPSPEQVRQRAIRGSVLNGLMEGVDRFRNRVSVRDRFVIDAHLDHIRQIEIELEALGEVRACMPPTGVEGDPDSELKAYLFADIIVAAMRCGLTNVANLEIADFLTPWTEAGIQVESGFNLGHSLHHMARDVGPEGPLFGIRDAWEREITDNRKWRVGVFQRIAAALADPAFAEGDATMLDNSLMLYTSEFSDGSRHSASDVPVLMAGSAGGFFRPGTHLNFKDDEGSSRQSTHNLYTSILNAFGSDVAHFGSADAIYEGPMSEIHA